MIKTQLLLACAACALSIGAANADTIQFSTEAPPQVMLDMIAVFEARTGHDVVVNQMPVVTNDQFAQYKTWFSQQSTDVDVIYSDIIWAPQFAEHLVDLTDAAKDVVGDHFPWLIQSQTIDGRLIAIPVYTGIPALFYRKDLLEKYGLTVPKTWAELTTSAQIIQDGERAGGNPDFWGFLFQGAAYEGLTCDAIEWVQSFGGGDIVEPDGTISINNPKAAAALDMAASWVGTISPEGVLAHMEEDSRGIWQNGNAAFLRSWTYAYALGQASDSPIAGKFDIAPLPAGPGGSSANTLGGWNAAVSKYSLHKEAAIEFALFLGSAEFQKAYAMSLAEMPTIISLYSDPDLLAAQPVMPQLLEVLNNPAVRPSAATKGAYNEVSAKFWTAAHNTLAGNGTGAENLEILAAELEELKGSGW